MALPPPLLWQDFEELTLDMAKFLYKTQNATKYGNQGAAQNGVDVFCRSGVDNARIGIQCKRSGKTDALGRMKPGGLTVAELSKEVLNAESYPNGLDHYIIATTLSRKTKLQDEAERLSSINLIANKFSVQIWFWEDFIAALHRSAEMLNYYYSNVLQLKGMYSVDHQILQLIQMAFSRPAFNVRLCNEDTGTGLQDALRDTETALNVGHLQDRMTKHSIFVAPGGLSMITNSVWKNHAKAALQLIKEVRAEMRDAIKDERLLLTPNRIIVTDGQTAANIDKLRKNAIDEINQALRSAGIAEVETDL